MVYSSKLSSIKATKTANTEPSNAQPNLVISPHKNGLNDNLIKNVNKIVEWKNRAEARISSLETQMDNLKESFDQLHKAVIGKVSEYDKHILDVGTEIKAMEKVFSKVLPTFTENVHELSRITERVKTEKR